MLTERDVTELIARRRDAIALRAYCRKLPIPREALKRAITNDRTRVGHRTVACHGLRRPPPGGREHGGRA